ncbi:MAG: DNA polymerase IV [Castellaniella sp.]
MADCTKQRRVAHLDMDAFFASVELLRYPELGGMPVVIGGRGGQPVVDADGRRTFARMADYAGRGVVTTATYEARAFGIGSAMPMMKAAALAPRAVRLPVDFPRYRDYSRRFKEAVAGIAPQIEDRGIDEIYIELTAHEQTSQALADELKQAVRAATGLSCSIGIAPNKLLAKIASELDKPDGLTVLHAEDVQMRVWPLPVSRINGIGPKATQRLARLGIHTVADLAGAAPALLQRHFGLTTAQWLVRVAHGVDDRPVVTVSEPKSISRETTFERDLHVRHDKALLSQAFRELCSQVAGDLARKAVTGRTVGVKLRFDDFRTVTRDYTVAEPVRSGAEIHRAARQCLRRIRFDRRVRLMGVRVSRLESLAAEDGYGGGERQLSLDY